MTTPGVGRGGAKKKKTLSTSSPLSTSTSKKKNQRQDDIFEWYFAIRGPRDSDFEGGIYLGRLTLPPDYPLAPPSFTMLTRSGRFETGVRICLSISSFHADLWSPSWSVRSALLALAAFMPSPGAGAVGAIEGWPSEEVRAAALASRERAPRLSSSSSSASGRGGSAARQAAVDRLHARLLAFEEEEKESKGKEKVAEVEAAEAAAAAEASKQEEENEVEAASAAPTPAIASTASAPAGGEEEEESGGGSGLRQRLQPEAGEMTTTTTMAAAAAAPAPLAPLARTHSSAPNSPASSSSSSSWEDALLTALAGALLFAIAGIIARKALLRIL